MKESFESNEPKKINRRGFLGLFGGALSSAAVSGIPAAALLKNGQEEKPEGVYDQDALAELLDEENTPEKSFEGFSNSKHFIQEIVRCAEKYERELPTVLAFAQTVTHNDPEGRNRMDYLREMIYAEGVPEVTMEEIKKQILGLAFVESRFDASRVSLENAQGILQIIPSTWKDLSESDENILSLVDQTRVAGDLLSQTYRHLRHTVNDELQALEAEFFHGDHEAFERYFLAPVLINAYNAGMGTMQQLVAWFARTYGTEEKTVGLLGQEEKLSGHDVFMAMAKKGKEQQAVSSYKEDASAYTFEVYGAAMCVLAHPQEEITA